MTAEAVENALTEVVHISPEAGEESNFDAYGFGIIMPRAGQMVNLSIECRDSGSVGTEPVWLKVWRGSDSVAAAVSLNSQVHGAGKVLTWEFEPFAVEAGVEYKFLMYKEASLAPGVFTPDFQGCFRVVRKDAADGLGMLGPSGGYGMIDATVWQPVYVLGLQVARFAAAEHAEDAVVHVTAEERSEWAAASRHVDDAAVHVSAEERARWDAAAEGGGFVLTAEAVQEVVPMRWGEEVSVGTVGARGVAVGGTASGKNATALGSGAEASESACVAVGVEARATKSGSIALGYAAASGNYSMALGSKASAGGSYATALGYSAAASDYYSTALGLNAAASGYYSIALGEAAASGDNSMALGYNASAGGSYATALGSGANASGQYATALGYKAAATNAGQLVLNAHHGDNTDFSLELQAGAKGTGTGALGADDEFVTGASVCFRVKNGRTGQEESVTIEAGKLLALLRRVDELLALLPDETE